MRVPLARAARRSKRWQGSGIPVAAVSTGFPAGLSPIEQRMDEIRASVAAGAREIDIVITRAHVLTGNYEALYDEVRRFREACGDAHMKAILATGELATLGNVARASMVAMQAGADFIKTSTGKEGVNATIPFGVVMCRMIREYFEQTGFAVGFKPAGGIRAAKNALEYLYLMKEELGDRWLQPGLFRFGASALLTDIERQLEHFVTGRYAAAHRHAHAVSQHDQFSTMATVAEIFQTMEYGPAPESDKEALAWLGEARARVRPLHRRRVDRARRAVRRHQPGDVARSSRASPTASSADVDAAVAAARSGAAGVEGARAARARAAPVRARARRAEAFAPARRAREHGQRQVDSRDARHRRAARRAALLSSRRLGAAPRLASSPATRRSASSARSFRGTSRC